MSALRIRCAGLYIEDDRILLVKHRRGSDEYYLLPGGGQEPGESLREALAREWMEELSLQIDSGDLLFCGESMSPAGQTGGRHILQMVFEIKKISGQVRVCPDASLFAHAWLPLAELPSVPVFPDCVGQIMQAAAAHAPERYRHYRWL